MSAAHTPGPWVKDRYQQLIAANGKQVGVWGCGISWVSRDDEAEANARLISAAPDMLEALRWIETYARVQVERHPEAEDTPGWARILAAIAKATTVVEPNSVGTSESE